LGLNRQLVPTGVRQADETLGTSEITAAGKTLGLPTSALLAAEEAWVTEWSPRLEPNRALRDSFRMIDVLESAVAPSAIERAMETFEKFKDRDRAELVQARKVLTDHIFALIAAGETDEQRVVVSGLAHLKIAGEDGIGGGEEGRLAFR
jgi:hypothetical protein